MKNIITWLFGVSTDRDSLGNQFRQKRMALFKEQLHTLPKPVNILDVGGAQAFWVNTGLHDTQDIHITILNLTKATTHYKNISALKGDATDLSAYKDDAFDIVFSNSVIEHLYTKDNQKSMAKRSY